MKEIADRLRKDLNRFYSQYNSLDKAKSTIVLSEDKWSLNQIVGHLIDSASNNHQRFVRLRIQDKPNMPDYDKDDWLRAGEYNKADFSCLMELFRHYNNLLADLMENTDSDLLARRWEVDWGADRDHITLGELMNHYVEHLETHLEHFETRLGELEQGGVTSGSSWEGGRIFQVDSFTTELFKGNPAGIVFVEGPADPIWMQNVAFEMNLSETAFVSPGKKGYDIRYFTPTNEVPICGHATLAAAHVLFTEGLAPTGKLTFFAPAGELPVSKEGDEIIMDFPIHRIKKIPLNPSFPELIGFEPLEMYEADSGFLIALARDEEEVRRAAPLFERMESCGLGDLLITAPGSGDRDFVLRSFAPAHGIDEDPVTGSAHCCLVPYWQGKTGKSQFLSYQLSRRGGELKTRLLGDRVEIRGKGITLFSGRLSE